MRILSSLLLLWSLASFSNSETCPEKEILYPCSCEKSRYTDEITVKCFPHTPIIYLKTFKKILTDGLLGKKKVDLVLDNCPWIVPNVTIPSSFFSGLDIKQLSFENCETTGLTDDNQPPLLGLENNLERLQLQKSFVRKMGPSDFNFIHLRKLKDLYVSNNQIEELDNDFLNNLPTSLETLILKDNGILKIGDRAFSKLTNLRRLTFEGDLLRSLQRSMFPNPASRLKTLSVRNTGLRSLPEDIFSNMPALRNVDIYMNDVIRLDLRTWQPVWTQLSSINVYYNPIKCRDMNWIPCIFNSPSVFGECYDLIDNRRNRLAINMFIKGKCYN